MFLSGGLRIVAVEDGLDVVDGHVQLLLGDDERTLNLAQLLLGTRAEVWRESGGKKCRRRVFKV